MDGSVGWQTVEKVYGSISKREHGLCEMMLAEGLVGPAGPPVGGFSVPSPRTMSSTNWAPDWGLVIQARTGAWILLALRLSWFLDFGWWPPLQALVSLSVCNVKMLDGVGF